MVFFCCYLFVSYTQYFLLLPRLQTFQGWAGKKAASLWTVYCSGFSNGVIIKKQKGENTVKSNKRQNSSPAIPTTIENSTGLT